MYGGGRGPSRHFPGARSEAAEPDQPASYVLSLLSIKNARCVDLMHIVYVSMRAHKPRGDVEPGFKVSGGDHLSHLKILSSWASYDQAYIGEMVKESW